MMKSFKFYLSLLLSLGLSYPSLSFSYEDYELYIVGKTAYQNQNYQTAKKLFLDLERSFPYSKVQNSDLAPLYLGLSYYRLGEYEEAKTLLLKSIVKGHEQERDLALAEIYEKEGKEEQSSIYFYRLLSSQFSYSQEEIEKKIRPFLSQKNPYYEAYFSVKLDQDPSSLLSLQAKDMLEIFSYLDSKGDKKQAQDFMISYLKQKTGSKEVLFPLFEALLKSFLDNKQTQHLSQYASLFSKLDPEKKEHKDFYLLQKARAARLSGDYPQSLHLYEEIQHPLYLPPAIEEQASVYYYLQDYEKVIALLEQKKNKTTEEWRLLGDSYLVLGKEEPFLSLSKKLQSLYAADYENIFYQYLLAHREQKVEYNPSLSFMTVLVEHYLENLYDFDFQAWKRSNSLEYQKILELERFQDEDVLNVELENSQFWNLATTDNTAILINFYERAKLYHKAYQSAKKQESSFAQYKNMIHKLFPRYYEDLIQDYALRYSIPEEILYTLILASSAWDANYEKGTRLGLFALDYRSTPLPSNLLDVKFSLDLACQMLKKLEKKYKNPLPRMVAFLYGEKYADSLPFEENGDLFLLKIMDGKEKESLEKLMLSYIFYKKLYYF